MRCVVASFSLARTASPPEHYEDAFCARRTGTRRATERLRLAVADGASESMLSGLWARALVRAWCGPRRRDMGEVVAAAMSGWDATLAAYLDGREAQRRPIEWFERPGLERGAHATLLGVEVTWGPGPGDAGRWSAASLGDSCLFQVRGDALVAAFPLGRAAAFGNAPPLVPTRSERLGRVVASLDRAEGSVRPGDALFLATDGVAAWFLASAEAGRAPWAELGGIARGDAAAFARWAGGERAAGRLRDDDLTLLRVEVAG